MFKEKTKKALMLQENSEFGDKNVLNDHNKESLQSKSDNMCAKKARSAFVRLTLTLTFVI